MMKTMTTADATMANQQKKFPLGVALVAAACACAVLSVPAAAAKSPNYDTLDVEYAASNFDDGDIEFDVKTGVLNVSAQLLDNFFVTGGLRYGELDIKNLPGDFGNGLKVREITLGVGGFVHLIEGAESPIALDLAGRVFALHSDLEDSTDKGWGAAFGPRMKIGDRWEVQGEATYFDVGDDGVWEFGLRSNYELTDLVAVQAGVFTDEDGDSVTYTVGARLNIGD